MRKTTSAKTNPKTNTMATTKANAKNNTKTNAKSKSKKQTNAKGLNNQIRNIKMLITDVDGCLTDGTIWLDSNLQWRRSFNVLDGVGLKLLMDLGYQVGIITGGNSEDVRMRMKFLGIEHFYDGVSDKIPAFKDVLAKTGLKPSEIAYVGDEIYDVPIMEQVGFSACPPRAVKAAKSQADYVTKAEGGWGAVREVVDLILEVKA